ncbi:MAG TPA: PQQ-dependent sugar dehydrogenase [Candidatus Limnocylindria bacterium]|nr:PQQ-dependent sugar dehydrogenase [Candidatus Limnocylindria bacterium]
MARRALSLITTAVLALTLTLAPDPAHAAGPTMLHPLLAVRAVVAGLTTPTSIAFLGPGDLLVVEKVTGQVKRVTDGAFKGIVLDLAVNFASERGLLGIALHPGFPARPYVYLYWTESTTGADTSVLSETSLLGNRVDRFIWNGSALVQDTNVIRIRAIQQDAGQPERGNHDGGVLRFGPDGKLYLIVGDVGRRGQMQNLPLGWAGQAGVPDDQFGGPEPDDAHLTGVILRLNDDGSAPSDNPFFAAGAAMGGEAGANVKKIFAYGMRNSFGIAFDPVSGKLWQQENADDAFDEINLVEPGMNGGWVQVMGPLERIAQFKSIELSGNASLQQVRWPPTNIADAPEEARARMFMLPGARYSDPEFSWKFAVPPAGIGFMSSRALGPQFFGDLFVGAATPRTVGGYLFRFQLTGNRRSIATDDPRLADRVADNTEKHDLTESESLLIGRDFGVITDIQTSPRGTLYVVSLSSGVIYEIYRREIERR